MRQIPTWHCYERLAAADRLDVVSDYGALVDEAVGLASSAEARGEASFFRSALDGRRQVLDLGCGPGFPLLLLTDRVAMLYGVDASPAMLAVARASIAALGVDNAVLLRALAEELPFADGAFDGFAVCGTLECFPSPDLVLSELARVAAPGAVVASLEEDFRWKLAEGAPREERWLRTETGGLTLQVVRYLTQPYQTRDERYVLDPASDFGQRILADPALAKGGRAATDLAPEDVPSEIVLDSFYDVEMHFDPRTLQESYERAGFRMVEQQVDGFTILSVFGLA